MIRTRRVKRLLDRSCYARRRAQELELVAIVRHQGDVFGDLGVRHCCVLRIKLFLQGVASVV
jgi:hypothetical protein